MNRVRGGMLVVLLALMGVVQAVETEAELSNGREVESELQSWDPKWYSTRDGRWKRVELEERRESTSTSGSSSDRSSASSGSWSMPSFGAEFIGYVILFGIIIGLLIFLYNLYKDRMPKRKPDVVRHKPSVAPVSLLSLPDDWGQDQDPQTELRRAIEQGEWRRAIIWSHVALIELLEQKGLISLYPGMSDRDCLDQLRQRSGNHSQLGLQGLEQTTLLLRRVLYAQEQADEEAARRASHQLSSLNTALSRAATTQGRVQ